jgi:hypothetical protein
MHLGQYETAQAGQTRSGCKHKFYLRTRGSRSTYILVEILHPRTLFGVRFSEHRHLLLLNTRTLNQEAINFVALVWNVFQHKGRVERNLALEFVQFLAVIILCTNQEIVE